MSDLAMPPSGPTTHLPWYARLATTYGRPAVLIAAIALSAPGEYQLARMAGWTPWVAWLMPFTISVYAAAAAALAASRPKGARASAVIGSGFALLLALAAQVVAHLLTSGHMRVSWQLIAVVSAIPPAVVAHVLHLAAMPAGTQPERGERPTEQEPDEAEPDSADGEQASEPTGEPTEQGEQEPEQAEPTRFLTTREVADRYGVTMSAVGNWKTRGKITPALVDPAMGNLYDPEQLPPLSVTA
ncbi:hypothetical protein [Streptomyces sp. NPDC006267]|uniref:hypothetical protein n=1 Tax=Streptomyces sp. NPDC006267 TaxID=3157173 RepID=UPI0033A0BB32